MQARVPTGETISDPDRLPELLCACVWCAWLGVQFAWFDLGLIAGCTRSAARSCCLLLPENLLPPLSCFPPHTPPHTHTPPHPQHKPWHLPLCREHKVGHEKKRMGGGETPRHVIHSIDCISVLSSSLVSTLAVLLHTLPRLSYSFPPHRTCRRCLSPDGHGVYDAMAIPSS